MADYDLLKVLSEIRPELPPEKLHKKFYVKFYLRPTYILRTPWHMLFSWAELKRAFVGMKRLAQALRLTTQTEDEN